ncbi:MAG: nucleotidyltransferase substrate binding protein [Candidatus Promineifilaceae bacterium]
MSTEDIRWVQRFNNFTKALRQLQEAVELSQQRALSKLEEQGLIQGFEYTYELAWNVLKDYFEVQGETAIHGSRDAFRLAFQRGLVQDGETWMEMITSRILTAHTYNEEMAQKIAAAICQQYYPEFLKLHDLLAQLKETNL